MSPEFPPIVAVVCRHLAARHWIARHLGSAPQIEVSHLDAQRWLHQLSHGGRLADIVVGVLPIDWIARLEGHGIATWVLQMKQDAASRRQELTVDEMHHRGAHLRRYAIAALGGWKPEYLRSGPPRNLLCKRAPA